MNQELPKGTSVELIVEDSRALTEADLVARSQTGDEAAFEQLYRRHVGRIYALCLRMAADVARADELTEQTFIRAWEMLKGFRGTGAFGSWLHRIAVNVVLVDVRAGRRRTERVELSEDPEELAADCDPNPSLEPIDLDQAIALLPPKARAVLILHDIEGYQHEEIAIMLDIDIGTSKSQLHRAHKLVKERLLS